MLVCGQISRVEGGDHIQTGEAAAADKLEVHHPNVTPMRLDAHRAGRPLRGSLERDLDRLPSGANGLGLRAVGAVARLGMAQCHCREL